MQTELSKYYDNDIKSKIENILIEKNNLMSFSEILEKLIIIYPESSDTYLSANLQNCVGDNCLEDGIFFEFQPVRNYRIIESCVGLRSWLRRNKPFPTITAIKIQKEHGKKDNHKFYNDLIRKNKK